MPERPSGDRIDQALRAVVAQVSDSAGSPPEQLSDISTLERTYPMLVEPNSRTRSKAGLALAGIGALILLIGAVFFVVRDDDATTDPVNDVDPEPTDPVDDAEPPDEADTTEDALTSDELRAAFEAAGGLEGLTLGTAEGAFELVTFDPNDPNQVLAAVRDGAGPADNSDTTELWTIADGDVVQELWAPNTPHDFAHFNPDGSTTRWELAGAGSGLQPRVATTTRIDGEVTVSDGRRIARFVVDRGTPFIIDHTGNPDRYASLVAESTTSVRLSAAADLSWVDRPVPGVIVAYPTAESGNRTQVWDTATLEPLLDHPLADQSALRLAVSGDGSTGARLRTDGTVELFDPSTGAAGAELGPLDATAVEQAITVDDDGSIVVTIDADGTVTLYATSDAGVILRVEADASTPRLIGEEIGSRATSTVSFDGSRLALRWPAFGTERVSYQIVDIDPATWSAAG